VEEKKKVEKKVDGEKSKELLEEMKKYDITAVTAKKIIERVKVMNLLQTKLYPFYLNYDEDEFQISNVSSQLPRWWKSPEHDYELIKGVKDCGFDFKKIFSDKTYIFEEVPRTVKKQDISKRGIYPREGICTKRLEALVANFTKVHENFVKKMSSSKTPPKNLKKSEKKDEIDEPIESNSEDELDEEKKKSKKISKQKNIESYIQNSKNEVKNDNENIIKVKNKKVTKKKEVPIEKKEENVLPNEFVINNEKAIPKTKKAKKKIDDKDLVSNLKKRKLEFEKDDDESNNKKKK
jgi:hypothetical protein